MKRFGKRTLALASVLIIFIIGIIFGFSMGFEYGTGLPFIPTLMTPTQESVGTPDIALKTTEEAKQVVEEAVKDDNYDIGYNCLDYAWDSMRALNWDGQPAAIAGIIFEDGKGHTLVLTATTDDNWLFLDPQSGAKVTPIPGSYFAGEKIVALKIMVIHWVDYDDFVFNPVFEVKE